MTLRVSALSREPVWFPVTSRTVDDVRVDLAGGSGFAAFLPADPQHAQPVDADWQTGSLIQAASGQWYVLITLGAGPTLFVPGETYWAWGKVVHGTDAVVWQNDKVVVY